MNADPGLWMELLGTRPSSPWWVSWKGVSQSCGVNPASEEPAQPEKDRTTGTKKQGLSDIEPWIWLCFSATGSPYYHHSLNPVKTGEGADEHSLPEVGSFLEGVAAGLKKNAQLGIRKLGLVLYFSPGGHVTWVKYWPLPGLTCLVSQMKTATSQGDWRMSHQVYKIPVI